MAKQLPCPNPRCTHTFSAEQVQSAELLKCPGCGQQFRFRPPAPAAPPAASAPAATVRTAGTVKMAAAKPDAPLGKPAALGPKTAPPAKAPPAAPLVAPAAKLPVAAPLAVPVPVAVARPVAPAAAPIPTPVALASDQSVDVEMFDGPVALPEPPLEPFVAPTVAPVPLDDGGPLLRPRRIVKKGWTAKHYVILSFSLLLAGGLMTAAVVFRGNLADYFRASQSDSGGGRARLFTVRSQSGKQDERAFQIAIPERWKADPQRKIHLQATTAWSHEESDAWFAIAVQDYGQQRPRDSELIRTAIERLEGHFKDALELANKTYKTQLAGEDCQSLRFKGTYNTVTWFGECYMLTHHGLGYWMFVATSTRWDKGEDAAWYKSELEKAKSFALVTDRKGWTEQPVKMDTFRNQEGFLTIALPSGVWEKNPARDVEETGELFLLGRFLKEKDNRKNASILVFTSDKKSDLKESMREARSYVEKRKQEENEKYKYLLATEGSSEAGSLEAVGDRPGAMVELKLHLGDEPVRYALLAVVHFDGKAYVIRCECLWDNRQIWQQDFRNALATLKFSRQE